MNANLQDLRAEARAEMNERFHEVSESDAVWLDTLIDSVLDRAEECVPGESISFATENGAAYEKEGDVGWNACRKLALINLSTLRS